MEGAFHHVALKSVFERCAPKTEVLEFEFFYLAFPEATRACIRRELFVACPIFLCCKNRYIYKVFHSEHTEVVYIDRLNACEDILSGMQLDDLYEESIQRSHLRLPTLRGDTHVLRTREEYYKKKPWMAFSAILEG
jgi:hypothetical protein